MEHVRQRCRLNPAWVRGSSFLREAVYLPRRVKRTNCKSAPKNYCTLCQTMFDTFHGLCWSKSAIQQNQSNAKCGRFCQGRKPSFFELTNTTLKAQTVASARPPTHHLNVHETAVMHLVGRVGRVGRIDEWQPNNAPTILGTKVIMHSLCFVEADFAISVCIHSIEKKLHCSFRTFSWNLEQKCKEILESLFSTMPFFLVSMILNSILSSPFKCEASIASTVPLATCKNGLTGRGTAMAPI